MIALIIFVFGELCIFFPEIYTTIPLSIFVFGEFAFSTEDMQTLWQNRHDSIDFFFAVNLAALEGAIPKLHVKNLPEKNCRSEGAILQVKFTGEKV